MAELLEPGFRLLDDGTLVVDLDEVAESMGLSICDAEAEGLYFAIADLLRDQYGIEDVSVVEQYPDGSLTVERIEFPADEGPLLPFPSNN